ncbi:MAG: tripartite tricarboxylate transporter TctB family protein [Sphingomonadales bacterium]|nr:tripartite tricarboxylate transporter TctB family protein [Sphingomonadales bacterium]
MQDGIIRAAEITYVALILAVAGVVWLEAGTLPPAPYDPLGPKAFPTWVSYALASLGFAMLVRLLFGHTIGRARQAMVVGLDDLISEGERRPWTAVLTLILAFAYACALSSRSIGFLPATAVYLFLAGAALGPLERRRLVVLAVFAVAAAVLLDLLFRRLFKLDLT